MPTARCSRCNQPVSAMTRDLTTGLCARCRAEEAQAAQVAIFDEVKRYEDRFLRLMLLPLPRAWRPGIEQALCHPRSRGLIKFVVGLIVAAAAFVITVGIGMLLGHYHASALVGLPLAISMIGLMEIILGINFADLAQRFDKGGFFLKCGIAIVVLSFVAVYLAGCVLIYRRYYQ